VATAIRAWDDSALVGHLSGKAAAIVAPGPSFDLFDKSALATGPIVALNAAITECWRNPSAVWACHDIHKIWRDRFEDRIGSFKGWQLLTRRVALPGKLGDGPYRAVGGGVEPGPFAPRLSPLRMGRARDVRWYSELEDQPGYLRATETVLEVALEALTLWGASPIVLVGVDLQPGTKGAYARSWAWKRCLIKPGKFKSMRRAMAEGRSRWPKEIVLAGAGWKCCPFECVKPENAAHLLSRSTATSSAS
jgi:hypothetical protein